MKIEIGQFEFTECWDGVFYKKLSNYPKITEWEIQTILDFIGYESKYGRECKICAIDSIVRAIENYKDEHKSAHRLMPPEKITECTACPTYKGCMTELVCHTSPIESAVKILDCGSLLSPVKARGMTAKQLKAEKRNAANDPEDYFHYIMLAWGNCQAGDRLVMERKLGRFPDENDLSAGFTPGVRFFFRYDKLMNHPGAEFEGVLPMKVKDEVALKDWVHAIIVPDNYRDIIEPHIPETLTEKIHFIKNDCADIWEWSEKVYEYARSI